MSEFLGWRMQRNKSNPRLRERSNLHNDPGTVFIIKFCSTKPYKLPRRVTKCLHAPATVFQPKFAQHNLIMESDRIYAKLHAWFSDQFLERHNQFEKLETDLICRRKSQTGCTLLDLPTIQMVLMVSNSLLRFWLIVFLKLSIHIIQNIILIVVQLYLHVLLISGSRARRASSWDLQSTTVSLQPKQPIYQGASGKSSGTGS